MGRRCVYPPKWIFGIELEGTGGAVVHSRCSAYVVRNTNCQSYQLTVNLILIFLTNKFIENADEING